MGADWTPKQGQVVGDRYELRDVIGTGGMGVVYAGFDRRLQRPVAVKFLNPTAAADGAALQRFQREALAAGRIGHENICDVRDLGTTEQGAPYIIMELLDGAPLSDQLLAEGRLSPEDAVSILVQVLAALDAAHAAGIVHRDLKPENIFLAESNSGEQRVKIVDFGISKALGDITDLRLTETGIVVGSPYYMSPEQARGRQDVDGRSDLWSVGVILYELLTGQLPFMGDNYNEVMIRIVTEEPRPPSELLPDIPKSLERVIMRALTKDRDERFGSARELAVALSTDSVRLFSVEPPSVEAAPKSRKGVVAAVAVAAVLVFGIVAGFVFVGAGGDEALLDAAVQRSTPVAVATLDTAGVEEASSLEVPPPTPPSDAPRPAEPLAVVVTLLGIPEDAALAFDGATLDERRLTGLAGHQGELVITLGDAEPLRVAITLTETEAIDLSERFRAAVAGGDLSPVADAGAERRRPQADRANQRGPRKRYISGRANSRITLEYEKS